MFHLGIVGLWFLSKCFLVYVNCLRRLFTYHCQNLVFTGALYANVCFCVISKQIMGYYANGVWEYFKTIYYILDDFMWSWWLIIFVENYEHFISFNEIKYHTCWATEITLLTMFQNRLETGSLWITAFKAIHWMALSSFIAFTGPLHYSGMRLWEVHSCFLGFFVLFLCIRYFLHICKWLCIFCYNLELSICKCVH